MYKTLIVLIIVSVGLFSSCDSGTTKKADLQQDEMTDEEKFPLSIQKGGNTEDLATIRAQARSLIDFRVENIGNPMAIMTVGFWHPEFVFNAGKMSKEFQYEGYWIDYDDDFTYTYGKYDKTWGSGRYHFDLDKSALILLDDNVEQEPKSFQANYNGEIMSYIGKHDWGVNNGMQIKMIPLDAKPVKS